MTQILMYAVAILLTVIIIVRGIPFLLEFLKITGIIALLAGLAYGGMFLFKAAFLPDINAFFVLVWGYILIAWTWTNTIVIAYLAGLGLHFIVAWILIYAVLFEIIKWVILFIPVLAGYEPKNIKQYFQSKKKWKY